MARDEIVQERGPAGGPGRPVATTYVRAVHPEHGHAVVFVPGEALPDWVLESLDGAHRDPNDGVVVLK